MAEQQDERARLLAEIREAADFGRALSLYPGDVMRLWSILRSPVPAEQPALESAMDDLWGAATEDDAREAKERIHRLLHVRPRRPAFVVDTLELFAIEKHGSAKVTLYRRGSGGYQQWLHDAGGGRFRFTPLYRSAESAAAVPAEQDLSRFTDADLRNELIEREQRRYRGETSGEQDQQRKPSLTFAMLREANRRRLPQFKNKHGQPAHSQPDGSDWSPAQWLQAATGELGEYANIRKKFERGDLTPEEFQREAADELADVVTYLDILAFRLGVDLGAAVADKFNRISKRVGADERVAKLDAALRRLAIAARITGGTAGPDADLMAACTQAEDAVVQYGLGDARSPAGAEQRTEEANGR